MLSVAETAKPGDVLRLLLPMGTSRACPPIQAG